MGFLTFTVFESLSTQRGEICICGIGEGRRLAPICRAPLSSGDGDSSPTLQRGMDQAHRFSEHVTDLQRVAWGHFSGGHFAEPAARQFCRERSIRPVPAAAGVARTSHKAGRSSTWAARASRASFPRELPVRASPAPGSAARAPSFPGLQAQPRLAGPLLPLRLRDFYFQFPPKLPSTLAEDARRRGLLAATVGTVSWAAIAAFPPLFRALSPPARPRPAPPPSRRLAGRGGSEGSPRPRPSLALLGTAIPWPPGLGSRDIRCHSGCNREERAGVGQ